MLTKKSKAIKNRKKFIITVVVLVVLLLIVGVLLFGGTKLGWFGSAQSVPEGTSLTPPTSEQIDNGTTIKESNVDGKPDTNNSDGTTTGADKSNVDVTITSPTTQSISSFSVRSYISKLTTDGSCTVTLTPSTGAPINKTLSGLQASNQISACPEFKFSSDQLTVGSWTVTVSYTSTTSTGTATQVVTIE